MVQDTSLVCLQLLDQWHIAGGVWVLGKSESQPGQRGLRGAWSSHRWFELHMVKLDSGRPERQSAPQTLQRGTVWWKRLSCVAREIAAHLQLGPVSLNGKSELTATCGGLSDR